MNHFLEFLLCIFRCLIPLFSICIWAELYPALLPVQHIVLKKERKHIISTKRKETHLYMHILLLLLWFEIFFCNCFSNQDSLSFKVLLNLKQNKILSLLIPKNLKSETERNLIIGDSQKQLWFSFFSQAWWLSFELFAPSGRASCSPSPARSSAASSTAAPPTSVFSAAEELAQTSPEASPLSLQCRLSIWNIHTFNSFLFFVFHFSWVFFAFSPHL